MGKKHIRISTNSNLPSHHQSLQEGDQRRADLHVMNWTYESYVILSQWCSCSQSPIPRVVGWLSDSPQLAATQLQRSHSPRGPGFSHGHIQPSPCGMYVQKCAKQNFELSTQAFGQHMEFFSRSNLTPPSVLLLPHRIQKLARQVLFQYILLVEPDSKSWTRKNWWLVFTGVFSVGFWLETCQVIAPSQIWRNLTQGSEILHWTISTF